MSRRKKLIIIIPSSAFAALVIVGFVYLQFFLFAHDLPEAGEEFALTDSVKRAIKENVDNGKHQSLFVGIVDRHGIDHFYYGNIEKDGNAIDENTVFEIGSISKVFTTLVLADMIEKGEISLDDPIDKFLQEDVLTPSKNDKKITVKDLATHTAGLPRFPDDFPILDSDKQFEYDREEMYQYLSSVELSRDIGSQYEYSNIGVSLLGHILALNAGQGYEDMIRERILDKFEMGDTCIKKCDKVREQLAAPHVFGQRANELNLSEDMAGAGEIRSSGRDMLVFLSYAMGLEDSSLREAFELAQQPRHKIDDMMSVGLGWHITEKEGQKTVWHNGATNGFASYMGFDPDTDKGVVVLTNSMMLVDDVAMWMLEHGS